MDSTASPSISVLVVDDDEFMRDMMQETLQSLGVAEVHCMAEGREALQWLRQTRQTPSLLIMDIYMPGMDGFEFIQALADFRYPGKVLLCSGVNMDSLALARDIADGMGLRVVGAQTKPLDAATLHQLLSENGIQPA